MISGSEPLMINISGIAIFTSIKSKYFGLNPSSPQTSQEIGYK